MQDGQFDHDTKVADEQYEKEERRFKILEMIVFSGFIIALGFLLYAALFWGGATW